MSLFSLLGWIYVLLIGVHTSFGADLLGTELTTWYTDSESLTDYDKIWDHTHGICGGFDKSTGYIWLWEPSTNYGTIYKYDISTKTLYDVAYTNMQLSICIGSPSSFFYNNYLYTYDNDDGIYKYNFDSSSDGYKDATFMAPPEYLDDPCFMISKDETQFYLVGDDSDESQKFYIYDLSNAAWIQGPSMNYVHKEGACAISDNNELYIIGSSNHGYVEKINLDSLNSWEIVNSAVLSGGGSYGRSAVTVENIIYVFGGLSDSTTYYINTNDDSIGELTSSTLEIEKYYQYAVSVPTEYGGDNRIYAFGGISSETGDPVQSIIYSNELKRTDNPSQMPSRQPSAEPTSPTQAPIPMPTQIPTEPSVAPTGSPTPPTVEPTKQPTNAPTSPTLEPTNKPTYDASKYVCSDGCVIDIEYKNDNYCDCMYCDDEYDWNCNTCDGGCPSQCGYFNYCPQRDDSDYSDDRDCIDNIVDGFQIGDIINVYSCAQEICESDIGGVLELLISKVGTACSFVQGIDSIVDIINDVFGGGDDDKSYLGIVATCWESEIYNGMKANYTAFSNFMYNYSYLESSVIGLEMDSDNYLKYSVELEYDDSIVNQYTLNDDNRFVAAIYDRDGTTKSEMVTYAITSLIEQYKDIFAYSEMVYNFTSEGNGDNLFKILRSNQGVLFTDHSQDLESDYQVLVCEANVVIQNSAIFIHSNHLFIKVVLFYFVYLLFLS